MQMKQQHTPLDELSLRMIAATEKKELQTMKVICVIPPFFYILHTQMIYSDENGMSSVPFICEKLTCSPRVLKLLIQ